MSYLFLDFSRHLDKGGLSKDFYNLSLKDQFKNLQDRYSIFKKFSLKTFIQQFFPSGMTNKYTFSCPNFIRDCGEKNDHNVAYLNNVVIRPLWDWSFDSYLPKNQNIILIGDIKETFNLASIEIKGIQLIDKNMKANKDITIATAIVYCFEPRNWSISSVSYSDSVLTADFIAELMKECYTVDDEVKVHSYYQKWRKYIDFRNYYIKEQEKRHFLIDNAVYCKSYAVNKKEYRKNSNIYDDYILDGNDDMKKGDMVVLNAPVEDADEFPLIRLDIDRNKFKFIQDSETKGNKKVNKEELAIRSLARDNVFITQDKPEANERGFFEISSLMNKGFILGDRFKISKYEVLPKEHIENLRKEETEKINKSNYDIELKYKKIVEDELTKKIKKFEDDENKKNNELIEEKNNLLNSELDKDVLENKDVNINNEIKNIKNKIEKQLSSTLKKDKKESKKDYQKRFDKEYEDRLLKINIRELYIKRNNDIIDEYKSKLEKSLIKNKIRFSDYTKKELTQLYNNDLRKEQIEKEKEINSEYNEYVRRIIESETLIRFSLYFRLPESRLSIESKDIKVINNCKYICYDSRAEKSKINRQEKALDNFFNGYVKNPYLSTYLFDPDKIGENYIEENEIKYNLPNLNDAQKKAVNSALSSNGLFLLQGPPGTGKTHVIAELVSQYVMRGKKVLISSETHKAIDNVFDRLPKIADIVPIRLIPSKGEKKKDNDYDPTHLIDNFYDNISHNMIQSINIYENFNAYKKEFNEKFSNLKLEKQRLDKSQKIINKYEKLIKEKESKVNDYGKEIKKLSDKFDKLSYELNDYRRTKKHIISDDLRLTDDTIKTYIVVYRNYLFELFDKTIFNVADFDEFINNFKNIDIKKIEDELLLMQGNNEKIELEIERDSIRAKMNLCKDEFDNVLPEKESEYNELKSKLMPIINKINNLNNGSNNSLEINKIFNIDYINNHSDEIVYKIKECQNLIEYKKNELSSKIDKDIDKIDNEIADLKNKLHENNGEIKQIHNEIQDIKNEEEYKDIENIRNDLDRNINVFIKNLHLNISYTTIDDALEKINLEWENLTENFETNEAKNKQMIPMYKKISNYVTQEDVIEGDKPIYTKELFNSANVFGITCTASDKFGRNNLNSLSEFNIDDFNIKDVGIDVVIIDEVSKSSFVDLLIPILYGKTVILVGDHRQLPPMYEFAKMREQDFEGLDPEIINKDINKEFTELYEECFFKKLFEDIHPNFKVMLNRQYRCHEDIMDVFNHFYNNELKIGEPGQNNKKKHNIDLMINGRTIISPDKHIYFINCNGKELQEVDSTSKSNKSEAKVVVELLSNLISYFKSHKEKEKPSLGVICTYGDQARKIKDMMKQQKVSRDYFTVGQEKQIISTVDDFQGDERDIIILSTVRNPIDPNKSNPEFILAYQRINVALSRARKLLIVVGNKKYLETKGIINLPAIDGNSLHDIKEFRLYENIIGTIQNKGKLLEETDIVVKEEGEVINA